MDPDEEYEEWTELTPFCSRTLWAIALMAWAGGMLTSLLWCYNDPTIALMVVIASFTLIGCAIVLYLFRNY